LVTAERAVGPANRGRGLRARLYRLSIVRIHAWLLLLESRRHGSASRSTILFGGRPVNP